MQALRARRRLGIVGDHAEATQAFLEVYNFAKRLKTLNRLTPYEAICKAWADEPNRFIREPTQLISGPNT